MNLRATKQGLYIPSVEKANAKFLAVWCRVYPWLAAAPQFTPIRVTLRLQGKSHFVTRPYTKAELSEVWKRHGRLVL